MAYFSVEENEDVRGLGSLGCGGQCRCGPCAERQAGRATLAEWYVRDEDEPSPPAPPDKAPPPQSAIGEPPPRLVLQPPSLFQRDPLPPLARRMQGVLTRGLPPLTLRPPFQPAPPPRRPDLFRLSPEFQREITEKWERERRNRELTSPPPPSPQRASLSQAIDRYIDENLNRLMSDLGVPPGLRGPIRNLTRTAFGRGTTEALDSWLGQTRLDGEVKKAIGASVREAMRQIGVTPNLTIRF
jgi:hypothetical protein